VMPGLDQVMPGLDHVPMVEGVAAHGDVEQPAHGHVEQPAHGHVEQPAHAQRGQVGQTVLAQLLLLPPVRSHDDRCCARVVQHDVADPLVGV
jgi:hypothetical protein